MNKLWLLVLSLLLAACDAYPPTPQTDDQPPERTAPSP